jgi:methylenetetrahydrofolate dehydrogenase (NADP+)/methenyltetrahydrofolate cyclohydrolase
MTGRVLDGQALATRMQAEITPNVAAFTERHGRPPGLGIVLAGNDPASQVYVRNKVKAGTDVGFRVDLERLPETATLADALALVQRLNESPVHDGILVQSPLPKAMGKGAEQAVFDTIAAEKDVDGFGAESVGLLVQNRPKLVACTPSGVIELLEREQIPIAGRHAVVIGRSDIVGKPMALLLLHRDATVTICHSKTPNLPEMCRQADILVAAVGRPGMVTKEFVKPGATVIDVGINRVSDAALASRLFAPGSAKLGAFQSKGSVTGRGRASQRRRRCGCAYAGAGRYRSFDDYDADAQHAAGREGPRSRQPLSDGAYLRRRFLDRSVSSDDVVRAAGLGLR